jgi:hypothetical protein
MVIIIFCSSAFSWTLQGQCSAGYLWSLSRHSNEESLPCRGKGPSASHLWHECCGSMIDEDFLPLCCCYDPVWFCFYHCKLRISNLKIWSVPKSRTLSIMSVLNWFWILEHLGVQIFLIRDVELRKPVYLFQNQTNPKSKPLLVPSIWISNIQVV